MQSDFNEKEDAFLVLYQLLSENQMPSDINIDFDIRLINIPVTVLRHHSSCKGIFWKQNFYRNFIDKNPGFEPSAQLIPVCQKLLHKLEEQIEIQYYNNVQKYLNVNKLAGKCLEYLHRLFLHSPYYRSKNYSRTCTSGTETRMLNGVFARCLFICICICKDYFWSGLLLIARTWTLIKDSLIPRKVSL